MALYREAVVLLLLVCSIPKVLLVVEKKTDYRLIDRSEDIIKDQDAEESMKADFISFDDLKCDPPEVPIHGYVTGSDSHTGSKIHIGCDDGYTINGPSVKTCFAVPNPFKHMVQWDPSSQTTCIKASPAAAPKAMASTQYGYNELDNTYDMPPFRIRYQPLEDSIEEEEEVRDIEDLPEKCTLPKKVGRCRGRFARFYYDTYTRECTYFIYGGCNSNENNFKTLKDCEQECERGLNSTL